MDSRNCNVHTFPLLQVLTQRAIRDSCTRLTLHSVHTMLLYRSG
jgi:hypothetical protein